MLFPLYAAMSGCYLHLFAMLKIWFYVVSPHYLCLQFADEHICHSNKLSVNLPVLSIFAIIDLFLSFSIIQ
jgi:hypothetical protein